MKTIYFTVAVRVNDDVDIDDVFENCDYNFSHEEIIDTEIVECGTTR